MPIYSSVKIKLYHIAAKREIFSRIKASSAKQQMTMVSLLKEIKRNVGKELLM